MSGGIDSSVTAALLHEQGYEVVGITLKTWDYAAVGGSKKETGCCSLDSINDARAIAVRLGFAHFVLDIREEFGEYVIDNFVEEYIAGRTPNPCVLCNTHIKWEALLRRADRLDCPYIATGHYARLRLENGRHVVSRGHDPAKDQSYVLWGVTQQCLARTQFPVGGFAKADIRRMATEMGFHHLTTKPESYEICFIPDNDYRGFLRHRMPTLDETVKGGPLVKTDGTPVGTHEGYPFYTIGQRKGLPALGAPYYVVRIEPDTNTVVIGTEADLLATHFTVRGVNLQKYVALPPEGLWGDTKIRYKDAGHPSRVMSTDNPSRVEVRFAGPVKSITPGQSAVFYENDDVVGGGWIETVQALQPEASWAAYA